MSICRGRLSPTMVGAAIGATIMCSAIPCVAQTEGAGQSSARQSPAPASAQSASSGAAVLEAIVVTASKEIPGGFMKKQTAAEAMSSVTPAAIREKLAAASPLQLVSTIPGVNFGSSDAYGMSVRNFITVRGLDQTEIGFLVENIPGTDLATYFPYSEAWADNENISDITLIPGNSRLQDPIISASGGELIESIRAPRNRFGGSVDVSAGSYGGWRTFGDIDTGYLGQSGVKAFLSYSHTNTGNYVGPGRNTRDHVDFKAVKNWSDRAYSSLFASYNNWVNARIPPLTFGQAENGIATDNLGQYQYSSSYVPGITTNYWKLNASHRTDYLLASNNGIDVGDNLKVHVTPYFRYTYTNAPGEAALSPTSLYAGNTLVTASFDPSYLQNGKLFTQNNVDFYESLAGVNSYMDLAITPDNDLIAGYWYQYGRVDWYSSLNLLDRNGNSFGSQQSTGLRTASGTLITGTNFALHTFTNEIFIGDTQSALDDRLQISLGFKEMLYRVSGTNKVIGAEPQIAASGSEPMPRLLVSYKLDPHQQVYANVTTNARQPIGPSTYVTEFNVATGGFALVPNTATKPEYSTGEQFGYRYYGPLNVDLNGFYMHLRDHQIPSLQYINGAVQNTAVSAGGESIKGASLELSTQGYSGFSLYGSAQYLYGTFDDNIPIRGDYLPTKGKQMVETPNWMGNIGARYERGPFFMEITGKYVGPQYATFMDDQRMPSYTIVDAALGYQLPTFGELQNPAIRINFTNLANKPYISSVAGVAPNSVATHGVNGTAIPAGTPIYYVGAPFAFMVTLSTEF